MIVPLLNFYTNVFAPYLGDSAAVLALEEVKPYPVGIRKPQPCALWAHGGNPGRKHLTNLPAGWQVQAGGVV